MGYNIMSVNAHGLNHTAKHFSLWQEACKLHNDIIYAQEIPLQMAATPKASYKDFFHIFMDSASSKIRGILFVYSLQLKNLCLLL